MSEAVSTSATPNAAPVPVPPAGAAPAADPTSGGTSGAAAAVGAPAAGDTAAPDAAPATLLGGEPKAAEPDAKPADEGATDAPPEPVAYTDFTIPEGVSKDDPILGQFSEAASKAGISQAQAQAIIDAIGPKMAEALGAPAKQWSDLNGQWMAEVKADPVFGGPKLDATLVQAGRLFDDFAGPVGSPERTALIEAMETTGAGNNPAIFRLIAKIAAEWSPPTSVRGAPPRTPARNPAAVLYPNAPARMGTAA